MQYSGTVTSGGIQTTTESNTVIVFQNPKSPLHRVATLSLVIKVYSGTATITLNDESVEHRVVAGNELVVESLSVSQFTIKEAGIDYEWMGLYP